MARTIAVINQKGGVGKTTTAINMGVALKQKGFKVLLVDMDPQCNLSYSVGGEYDNGSTILEMLLREKDASQCLQHLPEIDLIPGSSGLSSLDNILDYQGREFILKNVLISVQGSYDYVIIDSPPALGLITVSVLAACDSFIITAHADVFSMQGIGQLYNTYQTVQSYCNVNLKIEGILLTKHTDRFLHSRSSRKEIEDMAAEIGTKVFRTSIREAIAVRESQTAQKSLLKYAPRSKPAQDYISFVNELLEK